mmetsp:Transcript_12495/g.44940  ORF Transcript_12495/g.44940 Transcript_12495/m.44940 type:complete len:214 (-) Transcript_12495:144-785(-)
MFPQFPLMIFFLSFFSSSNDSVPSFPSSSFTLRRFLMNSFIFRSCSMSFPSSLHSFSKLACSLSACILSFAISATARSRASYARSLSSTMTPMSAFLASKSFSSLRYTSANTARSFLRLSIVSLSVLLCDFASLNRHRDLSSLVSSILIFFCIWLFALCAASRPPIFFRCVSTRDRIVSTSFSRSRTARFSSSVFRVKASACACRRAISASGP